MLQTQMAPSRAPLSLASAPGQLRMIEHCYRYAYLEGRRRLRHPLNADENADLLLVRKLVEGDADSSPRRRAHRRFPVLLSATVKSAQGVCSAAVLNVSAGGLYVAASCGAELGATVQVRFDAPGVEYVFTCTVVRCEAGEAFHGLGLSLCCVPLEIRRRRAA